MKRFQVDRYVTAMYIFDMLILSFLFGFLIFLAVASTNGRAIFIFVAFLFCFMPIVVINVFFPRSMGWIALDKQGVYRKYPFQRLKFFSWGALAEISLAYQATKTLGMGVNRLAWQAARMPNARLMLYFTTKKVSLDWRRVLSTKDFQLESMFLVRYREELLEETLKYVCKGKIRNIHLIEAS